MRILHLTLDLPWPPTRGAQIRDHALISRVAAEHEVDLVAFCERPPRPADVERMAGICRSVDVFARPALSVAGLGLHAARQALRGMPLATAHYVYPDLFHRLRERIATGAYDLFQIEHSLLAPYCAAASARPELPTVLSLHNLGATQYASMARLPGPPLERTAAFAKAVLMRRWEGRWADRFSRVFTVSEDDAAALEALGARTPAVVIPNGVEVPPEPLPPRPDAREVLFVGNLAYRPNADAVRFFLREVLPLLRAGDEGVAFRAAGHAPPADLLARNASSGVSVVADPPEIAPQYAGAFAVAVPLRAGGGSRLKILEALALGRPVVSTAVGAEGLGLADGREILIADDAPAMARALIRLRHEPGLSARLVEEGRRTVARRFDWSVIAERQLAAYRSLLG